MYVGLPKCKCVISESKNIIFQSVYIFDIDKDLFTYFA